MGQGNTQCIRRFHVGTSPLNASTQETHMSRIERNAKHELRKLIRQLERRIRTWQSDFGRWLLVPLPKSTPDKK